METINNDFEKYQKAKKQVQEIKGFYGHLFSFVIVIGILIYINLRYSPEVLWFQWTFFGWGIGLFFHAVKVFNLIPFFGKDWEEKKIQEFMEEEKKQNTKFQ